MSNSAFAHPEVRFVGINVCEMDAFKHAAIPVVADARVAIDEIAERARGSPRALIIDRPSKR